MTAIGQDSLKTRTTLEVEGKDYEYFSLAEAAKQLGDVSPPAGEPEGSAGERAPLRERHELHSRGREGHRRLAGEGDSSKEVPFRPARILMQDFTGVPAVVDLAAMRDGITALGGEPEKVNPLVPVDLVIDHSVMVDVFARPDALQKNVDIEFERNGERYEFLRWGQEAFDNFRVVPPGTGICHQVNLEYLGAGGLDRPRTVARPSPIPTRCTAPTATPRWSTASACSAGASAASRPRRRCSASRSPC